MLARTLLFLPGIGPVRERRLWRKGVDSWEAYRALKRVPGVRPRVKTQHDELLRVAATMVGRDPAFFARLLPASEHWRAYEPFLDGAAYLDIETRGTQDAPNEVTVVGIRLAGESRSYVRGTNYTPEAVSTLLSKASCLVTFNGASFDLPVLQADGVRLPAVPHVDLRPVTARAGQTGGLKKIEQNLGLTRPPEVDGLSGWDAVKLWKRWEEREDHAALDKLLAYNRADFENLEPLARWACAELARVTLADSMAQARLPLA